MTSYLNIINELGPNADLLLESDIWLDNERKRLATELTMRAAEFDSILRAIKFKRAIQQNNNVAVRIIERDELGNTTDVALRIMPITEALALLVQSRIDTTDIASEVAQRHIWSMDGYDVQTAEHLRAV